MEINNIYTRMGLLFLGITFLVIGFFIDLKISIVGLAFWLFSKELFTLEILKQLKEII